MFPLQKDIWTEVISLYKNMPFLWDKSDPKYTSRPARDIGYNIILQKYREHDKNANLVSLKKKIDNMRTSYRRELKKVLASRKNSSNCGDVYVPELWYFDSLSFLNKHIVLQPNMDSSDDEDPENSQMSGQPSYTEDCENFVHSSIEHFFFQDCDEIEANDTKRRKLKRELQEDDDAADLSSSRLQDSDWHVIGKSIAVQLKGLNGRQAAIAQKLIADSLYYAKLGKLNEYSAISLNETIEELSDF